MAYQNHCVYLKAYPRYKGITQYCIEFCDIHNKQSKLPTMPFKLPNLSITNGKILKLHT